MNYDGKYRWRFTWGDAVGFGTSQNDFTGYDGPFQIGRIYLDSPSQGWRWVGGGEPKTWPILPDQGHAQTMAEAIVCVEDFWDRLKAHVLTT